MRYQLETLLEICKHLHQRNLLAAADGNLSYRFSDQEIVMTPSGVNKSRLKQADLAWLNLAGETIHGNPSSERQMHLAIYKAVPEAKAIVHAHPPTAIAWSLARPDLKELPTDALPEVILAAGKIPVVPYARPGTLEMGTKILPFLPACRLLILARHGAVCWGESLEEAANGIERLEQVAGILKLADELGGAVPLPAYEIRALRELRKQIGPRII
jgi:L-fuculose-phosphate aldolase